MNYKAKTFYRGAIASNYDKERFSSLKGKLYDYLEKQSVKKCLNLMANNFKILDIPCGTGRITEYIHRLGYDVSGADISPDMLKVATNKSKINYYMRDIFHLDFPFNMFTVTTCVRLMGHLPMHLKLKALQSMRGISTFLIVTFYMNKKEIKDWYPLDDFKLKTLLKWADLTVLTKHRVCPGWSDGVTYLLT
jgi:SAM-dependent methyltransferase